MCQEKQISIFTIFFTLPQLILDDWQPFMEEKEKLSQVQKRIISINQH